MRRLYALSLGVMISLLGFVSVGISSAWALEVDFFKKDKTVCYEIRGSFYQLGQNVLRLNVKEHSPLNTYKEVKKLRHPRQTTYSVIGKKVTGPFRMRADETIAPPDQRIINMASVNGSEIVATKYGSRINLTINNSLSSLHSAGNEFVPIGSPVEFLECASEESSATPEVWSQCAISGLNRTEAVDSEAVNRMQLIRVDPLANPLCSAFQAFPGPIPR